MIRKLSTLTLLRSALAGLALASAVSSAQAVLTTYSNGDLFIGFRQTSASNTLAVNLGSVTKFLTAPLGGTAIGGSSFNLQFGVIPNTSTPVTNLYADLTAVFGALWATNEIDGMGVRWGVVGYTSNLANNDPINGYAARTLFITRSRTDPSTQTTIAPGISNIGSRTTFSSEFNGFSQGLGGGSFQPQNSTVNSSVAYIGSASDVNNWNTKMGGGTFGLGGTRYVEQQPSGTFQGTTNSVLDLWLSPNTGSTLATWNTYLGNFTLNGAGELTFNVVPEPSTYALLALAGIFVAVSIRRRKIANS